MLRMDIYRTYNTTTRSLTKTANAYAGQMGDSLSTRLHFEYDDLGYLNIHQAFIVFAVYDKDGNPLVYGPTSTPSFNGLVFDIPWDVTSRITSRRLEYQLWFLAEDVTWDGETWGDLDRTTVTMSAVDGIAIKPSISPKCGCNPPFLPTAAEPGVLGWISLWQRVGLIAPVEQTFDEEGRFTLVFRTYSGGDYRVVLDVPALEDGKIPAGMLNLINSEGESPEGVDYQIMTTDAVEKYASDTYTPKAMSISVWDITREYAVGSTVIYGTQPPGIYIALQSGAGHEPTEGESNTYWRFASASVVNYIVTSVMGWSETPSDEKVPSEKLVKESLDEKVNETQISSSWDDAGNGKIPTTAMTKTALADKLDASKVTNVIMDSNSYVPSGHAVLEGLATKTGILQAVPVWSESVMYEVNSTVIESGRIYVSKLQQIGHDPLEDVDPDTGRGTYWDLISGMGGGGGGSGSVSGLSIQFGDGIHTEYEILHNLGTYDIIYTIRETSAPRDYVQASVRAVTKSSVRVTLTTPPADNSLTFNVIAVSSPKYTTSVEVLSYTEDLSWSYVNTTGAAVLAQSFDASGDEMTGALTQNRSTSFTPVLDTFQAPQSGSMVVVKGGTYNTFAGQATWILNHSMSAFVGVQTFDDSGNEVFGSVSQNGSNTAVVTFATPVTGYAAIAPATAVETFPNASATWTFTHDLGRMVMVKVLDENRQYIGSDIVQSINQTDSTVTVTFSQTMAGYMLIF